MKLIWDSTRLLVTAFIGFMLATTGIAFFPEIGTPAAKIICTNSRQQSRGSSTATSSTVTRAFYCPTSSGKDQNITVWVAVVSALLYTLIGYVLGMIYSAVMLIVPKKTS